MNFIYKSFLSFFFCLVVLSSIVSAESGQLLIEDTKSQSHEYTATSGSGTDTYFDMSTMFFYTTSYTNIQYVELYLPSAFTFAHESEATTFTITSGGTGSGSASYNKNSKRIYLIFLNGTITSNTVTMTFVKPIYQNVTTTATVIRQGGMAALASDNPVGFKGNVATGRSACASAAAPDCVIISDVSTIVTNNYNVTYSNSDLGVVANVTIDKTGAIASTKVNISNSTSLEFYESAFNTNSYSYAFFYHDGIALNMSVSSGAYDYVIVNTTNSNFTVTTPPTPGTGGSPSGQISYNSNSFTIGNTYGVNASLTDANFSAQNTYYIYAYDADGNLVTGFPVYFSTQTYSSGKFWNFNKSGSYQANLSYCGHTILGIPDVLCTTGITSKTFLDAATAYIPPASYNFTVTTDQANYQPGNTMQIIANNPSPEPAYITSYGETGIITEIAWNTLVPPGGSKSFSRTIPQNLPLGTYTLNLATTQSYGPIVAQAVFNISTPGNTTNTLSALWDETFVHLSHVGTVTTTSNFNASTLTITSPGGSTSTFIFPANSTNYTLVTLDEVGVWNARIVDNGDASNFAQSNTTVTAPNPTDNETIASCFGSASYVCWDKKNYNQGEAYTISFKLTPKITDIGAHPYLEIKNPAGDVIYNESVNITYSSSQNSWIGSISGSFDPQASTGLYFARLITQNIFNEIETRASGAAQVNAGATGVTTTEGQVSTTTATNLLNVFGMIAFYGLLLYVGLLFGMISLMTRNGGQVSASGFIYAAVILANLIALIGLFDPFRMYVMVLTWIIAGATFSVSRRTVTGGD